MIFSEISKVYLSIEDVVSISPDIQPEHLVPGWVQVCVDDPALANTAAHGQDCVWV